MLSEQGLISAAMEIVNTFLRPYLTSILFSSSSRPQSPAGAGQSSTSAFIRQQQTERPPSSDTLMIVLRELAGLLEQLGNLPPVIQESLGGGEVLITVACSPAGSGVRGSAVNALCAFVRACPGRMGTIMESLYEGLKRDITTLGTLAMQLSNSSSNTSNLPSLGEVKSRALGHAYSMYGIYTLLATSPKAEEETSTVYTGQEQHISLVNISLHLHLPPISPSVLHTATSLLKSTLDQPLPIARISSEIGWTLVSGLMALGPHFVRPNLSALMVLWRNALPKPTVRDNNSMVGKEEWGFLLGVRGWAVGAMCAFLRWNNNLPGSDSTGSFDRGASKLVVTLDISRRLGTLLSNALGFANLFITAQREEVQDPTSPTGPTTNFFLQADEDGHDLQAYEALLRSHVHVAFALLGFATTTESIQRELITSTTSLFAGNTYTGSVLQVAIAAKEGSFRGLWKVEDGYAYGVNSIDSREGIEGDSVTLAMSGPGTPGATQLMAGQQRDVGEAEIEDLLSKPILGSPENDPLSLSSASVTTKPFVDPFPPATAVVNSSIDLFSALVCAQDSNGALKALSGLIDTAKVDKSSSSNMGRRIAVTVNSVWALLLSLRMATSRVGARAGREIFGGAQVGNIISVFLKDAILDPDENLRGAASEALGRLSSLSSSTFLGNQINNLVKEIVNNRDPYARAGCASAFGAIYVYAGGVAAQAYLKTVLNVLMSLANDPHPVVHYWSLHALAHVISASSLSYGPFIPSTMALIFKLYALDTHEPEGGTVAQANASGDLPSYQALCRIVDGVISAIGPELQDSTRTRSKIEDLVYELLRCEDETVGVEAIQCLRQMMMFAPAKMDMADLVTRLKGYLASPRRPLKVASINALYQLVQRDAFLLSKVGGDKLVEILFGMLDEEDSTSIEGVKNIITNWLTQTVTAAPSAWIDLCQRIMARTTASQQSATLPAASSKGAIFQDEESESLGAGLPGGQSDGAAGHSTARWRTQLFAMECLHRICNVISASGRQEHLDLRFAKLHGIAPKGLFVSRIPDLVRMAFSASAAYVTEIRLAGLVVLRDVITIFAKSPDPDYDDSLLLEQYQAPITAALTPAFSSDSTPEILSSAVQVCAIFVGCGVIKDVTKMGRILKLLTGALDQSKSSGSFSIGDVQQISPNAAVMLRISTLTAWAELLIASPQQDYLKAVIEPYRSTLAMLWIGALRDYASIRGDSEVLQESSSSTIDGLYMNLGKEILLPYYDDAWYRIIKAVAIMMQTRDPHILPAMDGKEGAVGSMPQNEGPTALFFVVFGLVYEALVQASTSSTSSASSQPIIIAALETMENLVRPEYAGDAILDNAVFDEFTSLCYRMAMMENATVHIPLVRTITSLASTQFTRSGIANGKQSSSSSHLQLTHCLRICAYVLRKALPSSSNTSEDQSARIGLFNTSFSALAEIGRAFGAETKEDIRGISITLYSELLKDETSEFDLIGPTLPALRTMLDAPPMTSNGIESFGKLIHGLISCCLQNIEETSNRSGPTVVLKSKNNFMAVVLVLSSLHPNVKLGRALIDQFCYLMTQRMETSTEFALTVAQCAKALIAASLVPTTNAVLKHCAGLLIPCLIKLVSTAAAAVDDQEKLPILAPALDEVLKTFTTFFNGVPETSRQAVLAVLLPTLALLLDPSRSPLSSLHVQAIPIVLTFASASPGPFKEVTDGLDVGAREVLEASVRLAVSGRQQAASSQPSTKRQISLKAF
ncbi:hypothetical protein FRC15_012050 [Serendipita sp. 397]|nr:hypothetical protein FRC15_012050 [Serendipita sp. 397]